jgi:hypothetical protein
MAVDELYCHRHRTLRRWERIGHPVDTSIFVLALGWLLLRPPSASHLWSYAVLAGLSCVVITKDEWQHKELCDGFENWLHALLFILHPTVLIWAGYLWWSEAEEFFFVIGSTVVLALGLLIYQILYWNVWRHDRQ